MRPWFAGGLLVLSLVAFPLVDVATGATTSSSVAYPSVVLTCLVLAGYLWYLSFRAAKARRLLKDAQATYPRHLVFAIAAETTKRGRFEQQILAIAEDGIIFLRGEQAREFTWSEVESVTLERIPESPSRVVVQLTKVGRFVFVPLSDRFLAARNDGDLTTVVDLINSYLSEANRS